MLLNKKITFCGKTWSRKVIHQRTLSNTLQKQLVLDAIKNGRVVSRKEFLSNSKARHGLFMYIYE